MLDDAVLELHSCQPPWALVRLLAGDDFLQDSMRQLPATAQAVHNKHCSTGVRHRGKTRRVFPHRKARAESLSWLQLLQRFLSLPLDAVVLAESPLQTLEKGAKVACNTTEISTNSGKLRTAGCTEHICRGALAWAHGRLLCIGLHSQHAAHCQSGRVPTDTDDRRGPIGHQEARLAEQEAMLT